jgi:hypothetical protein
MAKKAFVYDGTNWVDLASSTTDLSNYYTQAQADAITPPGAWTSYTPTLSFGWANGNGTWTARYIKIGKTVHVSAYFVIGSTTTKGAGCDVSLPLTAVNSAHQINGNAYCSIAGNFYPIPIVAQSGTTIRFKTLVANGVYGIYNDLSGTTPATFNTNDVIYFGLTYEAA